MRLAPLGFAIVGCGHIAQRHSLHAQKAGRLWGVCDIHRERVMTLAHERGCKPFMDYGQMLKALQDRADVIAICTPNNLHCVQTIQAFEAGYHVLCEKPMALTVHDCGEMIKAGERANRRLFIVKQNRYNPAIQHLRRLLDDGVLGRVYSVHLNCFWNRNAAYYRSSWKGTYIADGGTLFTQFSHFIDLLYWLIGDVSDVGAFMDNYCHQRCVEFEDSGVAILRFHNGVIGTVSFSINSHDRNMEGSLTLLCERGTIKIGGQYLNIVEYENIAGVESVSPPPGRSANDYGAYQGSMSNHADVYANVQQVLTSSGKMDTLGLEGLKTIEIIDKIYRAGAAKQ